MLPKDRSKAGPPEPSAGAERPRSLTEPHNSTAAEKLHLGAGMKQGATEATEQRTTAAGGSLSLTLTGRCARPRAAGGRQPHGPGAARPGLLGLTSSTARPACHCLEVSEDKA